MNEENAVDGAPNPLAVVQQGLKRLAYKCTLRDLVMGTQQWAALVEKASKAAREFDPDGTFSDEETDAVEVAIQETLRAVAHAHPAIGAAMAVAVGSTSIEGIPE